MHRTDDEATMRRREHLDEDKAGRRLDGSVAAGTPSLAHPVEGRIFERQIPLGMLTVTARALHSAPLLLPALRDKGNAGALTVRRPAAPWSRALPKSLGGNFSTKSVLIPRRFFASTANCFSSSNVNAAF